VVRLRSCRVIYYFDTPALGRRHQSFGHVTVDFSFCFLFLRSGSFGSSPFSNLFHFFFLFSSQFDFFYLLSSSGGRSGDYVLGCSWVCRVEMGMAISSVGAVVCWLLLEEASVLMEMKRLGKMERRPARGESEGERLYPLFGLASWRLEKGAAEREDLLKWGSGWRWRSLWLRENRL